MVDSLFSLTGATPLLSLARTAGEAIVKIYNAPELHAVETKADDSPLTQADLAAHQYLSEGLIAIADLPVMSEESALPAFAIRRQWQRYWLIDPLDGTKEFLQRNGEFTVNIALIDSGKPVLGIVHVPVTGISYLGLNSPDFPVAAWKLFAGAKPQLLRVSAISKQEPLRCLNSHRHSSAAQEIFLKNLAHIWCPGVSKTNLGSSLKFCRVAEGLADIYPRLAPTSEWDTAAAQAVLGAAGGAVVDALALDQGHYLPLRYNQRESVLNPWFYALGDRQVDWVALLQAARDL